MNAKSYIAKLAAGGRYHFTSHDAQSALGVSADATKLALHRLIKQEELATPARGFYTIVPPEYRSLRSLPAEQFIPALMKHLGLAYYAGLLSAAQYHGAAHHRPQEFQVMVAKNRRPIQCGAVRAVFIARKRVEIVPVQDINTPRGVLRISTPEATALDLVGYQDRVGGLDQVATVLSELHEKIDPRKLVKAAETAPVAWAQRLGYLLERADSPNVAAPLRDYVRRNAPKSVPLLPEGAPRRQRDKNWKLYINADIAVET